ncbi:molybdenum cofactor guanylyltransferase [Peribacillus sp. NPDC097675]|uniref:molybdenum cofactor guanylyltransferase n=1 Tax=Peribacillus sp. NPDC097675 TaxID=3390618 RepID=UPI003D032CD0
MDCTILLLAGGQSSRMGVNKALLKIGEEVNIKRVANVFKEVTENILVVTNSPEEYRFLQLPFIPDIYKGQGPLSGLHAGMSFSKTDLQVLSACDMPFVSAEAVNEMLSYHEPGLDAIIPEIDGRLQPLFAVYHKNCLPKLTECLEKKELKMKLFLEKLTVKIIKESDFTLYHNDPDHFRLLFFNMNTMEDYVEAKHRYQTEFVRKEGKHEF